MNQRALWSDPRVQSERRAKAEAVLGRKMVMPKAPRKRSRPRITAAERVDAYAKALEASGDWLGPTRRRYLINMLASHARETLERERRRRFVLTRWEHGPSTEERIGTYGEAFTLGDGWMKITRERRRNRAGT